jgi:oxalate decarboxylase/phosphoglucose isomerase-like protein (cupin superfamily)
MNNIIKKRSSFIIKTKLRDKDSRGSILSICDIPCKNVSIINCKENTIRSNHYHKKDYHIMYVVKGEIDYFYKTIKGSKIKYLKVKKNDLIFTPPMEVHATYFPKKTVLIVSSKNPRDQATYEKDTVRVELINKKNIKHLLKKNGW